MAVKKTPVIENIPAFHKLGMNPPIVEPINIPHQIEVLFILSLFYFVNLKVLMIVSPSL